MKAQTNRSMTWVVVVGWMFLGCAGGTPGNDEAIAAGAGGNSSVAGASGSGGCPAGYKAVQPPASSVNDDTPSLPPAIRCVPAGGEQGDTGAGSDDTTGQAGGGTSGDGAGGADQGGDTGSVPDDTGSNPGNPDGGGAICQGFNLDITGQTVGPNVMLAVDVSGSMNDPINAQSTRAKISDTKLSISALLNQWESKVRFGWMQFPAASPCTAGSVRTECGVGTAPALRTWNSLVNPDGGTPTGDSLNNLVNSVSLRDNTRSNFVVLLTDGVPTCPFGNGRPQTNGQPWPEDEERAVQAVRNLRAAEIDTFVIGIGEDLNNTSPAVLNRMAVEGGRPRAGLVSYHQVNTVDQLNTALGSVIGIAVSCSHILPVAPAAPVRVQVLFDGQQVARDPLHLNGFDYDAARNQLTFYGPSCNTLQNGQTKNAQVKINC